MNASETKLVQCAGLMVPQEIADAAYQTWPKRLPMQSDEYFRAACNNHVLLVAREHGFTNPPSAEA